MLGFFEAGDMILLQNEINLLDYIIRRAAEKEMIIVLNPSPYNGKLKGLRPESGDLFSGQ